MLAPTIGGYVTAAYGWHVVFLILMYWYCGSIGLFGLPHTHEPDTSISLKPKPFLIFGA
jgi:DHA1 family bicyclomycin/chloramphenicol resistance-like MFS transporter